MATGCPSHERCICNVHDMSMACEKLESITWTELVRQIPGYVETVRIIGSTFDAELSNRVNFVRPKPNVDIPLKVNVHSLDIVGSSLANLDETAFQMMPNLKEVHLVDAGLNTQVLSYLSFLKLVEVVNLSHNKLEEFPYGLLQSWPLTRELNLSHNRITNFDFHVSSKSSSVKLLDLSYNHISFLHPDSFENGTSLLELNLQSNHLKYLHPMIAEDLGQSVVIHLGNNPWACHCGLEWLVKVLSSQKQSNVAFADPNLIRCASPPDLQSRSLVNISVNQLRCEQPDFVSYPTHQTLRFMESKLLECNVSGYPTPSVYWLTPHGPIVHPDHKYWVPSHVASSPDYVHFSGRPSYFHAAIEAQSNGSLLFEDFRYYFDGQYTCIAINPAGSVDYSLNVTIFVSLPNTITMSLMWGFSSSGCFFLICMIIGGILHCRRRRDGFDLSQYYPELTITFPDDYYDSYCDQSDESYYCDQSPLQSYKPSPYRSPKKCVTPAEGMDLDRGWPQTGANIRETLESVRARLRQNMEKQVDKMKSQAQHVKQTSHRYMKNMKSSTGRTMKTLRHTSSQYVHKMREGMVLGVEQVKNHVQSMKELCGTGHMSHTISTISVSTDIDSNQKKAVVKSITYV